MTDKLLSFPSGADESNESREREERELSESERRVMQVLQLTPRDDAEAEQMHESMQLEAVVVREGGDMINYTHNALNVATGGMISRDSSQATSARLKEIERNAEVAQLQLATFRRPGNMTHYDASMGQMAA